MNPGIAIWCRLPVKASTNGGRPGWFHNFLWEKLKGICELAVWLALCSCTEVCMEYWIPVFKILEKVAKLLLQTTRIHKTRKGQQIWPKRC